MIIWYLKCSSFSCESFKSFWGIICCIILRANRFKYLVCHLFFPPRGPVCRYGTYLRTPYCTVHTVLYGTWENVSSRWSVSLRSAESVTFLELYFADFISVTEAIFSPPSPYPPFSPLFVFWRTSKLFSFSIDALIRPPKPHSFPSLSSRHLPRSCFILLTRLNDI